MIGYIFCHNCTGTDKSIVTDGMATDNSTVGAQCSTFFYQRRAHLIHLADFRPGVVDVGKDHRGAAENTIFQCNTFIDADVVLYLAFVADHSIRTNDYILTDVAVFADFRKYGKMAVSKKSAKSYVKPLKK